MIKLIGLALAAAVSESTAFGVTTLPRYSESTGGDSISDAAFRLLSGSGETPKTILDNKDGYVYYTFSAYKSEFTDKSNLFLLNAEFWFTPGYAASEAGYSGYASVAKLGKGSVSISLSRYVNAVTSKMGPRVSLKAFWPQSSDVYTTVSSSYGGSVSFSGSWGKSIGTSFGTGDGAKISAKRNSDQSLGLSLQWGRSMSSAAQDPRISAQMNPKDSNSVSYNYEIAHASVAGKLTYHLNCYILFEMDKTDWNTHDDVFNVNLGVTTKCYWYNSNPFVHNYVYGKQYTASVAITNFNGD